MKSGGGSGQEGPALQMPVHNTWFDSMTISAGKGLLTTQTSDLHLHGVKLITPTLLYEY